MGQRHKVFVSFHHGEEDDFQRGEIWKDRFVDLMTRYTDGMVNRSVNDGDIEVNLPTDDIHRRIRENYLADSTVTVVLIGPCTWARKHVDWEISATLRDTSKNPRSGLLGILLPTFPFNPHGGPNKKFLPRRLYENLSHGSGYANLYNWSDSPITIQGWIHDAFQRRQKIIPTYSTKDLFKNSRPCNRFNPQGWSY